MSKIEFNFSFTKFILDAVQYGIAVAAAIFISPWLGVFLAMIRINVR